MNDICSNGLRLFGFIELILLVQNGNFKLVKGFHECLFAMNV